MPSGSGADGSSAGRRGGKLVSHADIDGLGAELAGLHVAPAHHLGAEFLVGDGCRGRGGRHGHHKQQAKPAASSREWKASRQETHGTQRREEAKPGV